MSNYNFRLGSTLTFNKEKEADLIKKIEYLTDRHMLKDFIANMLRIALDSPESLNSKKEISAKMNEIEQCGMLKSRKEYFEQISRDISDIRHKVDLIYNMSLKTSLLGMTGKRLGIEEKSNNLLCAQFILQKQLEELCETLGVKSLDHVYESNKIKDTQKFAEDILEYIIESYDGLLNEVVSNRSIVSVAGSQQVKENGTKKLDEVQPEIVQEEEKVQKEVDFSHADLSALSNFFGEA